MTTHRGGHLLWLGASSRERKNIFIAPCMVNIKPRNQTAEYPDADDAEYGYFLRMCSIKDN